MENVVYRCSHTGSDVQVRLADLTPSDRADSYEVVPCPACGRAHLVNRTTGRTLGEKKERK